MSQLSQYSSPFVHWQSCETASDGHDHIDVSIEENSSVKLWPTCTSLSLTSRFSYAKNPASPHSSTAPPMITRHAPFFACFGR